MIGQRGVVRIDFETAERSNDKKAMEVELKGLEDGLLDTSGVGGVIPDDEES